MTKRIYCVTDGDEVRLVDAANAAQALRHVVRKRFDVAPAKPKDIADLIQRGVRVELTGLDVDEAEAA